VGPSTLYVASSAFQQGQAGGDVLAPVTCVMSAHFPSASSVTSPQNVSGWEQTGAMWICPECHKRVNVIPSKIDYGRTASLLYSAVSYRHSHVNTVMSLVV
jgi:hypothetical protein